jgi:hypothetical protein
MIDIRVSVRGTARVGQDSAIDLTKFTVGSKFEIRSSSKWSGLRSYKILLADRTYMVG